MRPVLNANPPPERPSCVPIVRRTARACLMLQEIDMLGAIPGFSLGNFPE
jgi:hypothetical protein